MESVERPIVVDAAAKHDQRHANASHQYRHVRPFGHGNYNALFLTFRARDCHGITAISNFTWGAALGTGDIAQSTSSSTVLDPWNVSASYGPQAYDRKFIYNLSLYYQAPYFLTQRGVIGHIFGGWTIAPLFTSPVRSQNLIIPSNQELSLEAVRR